MWPFGRYGVAFRWATVDRPAAILANRGTANPQTANWTGHLHP